jgi:hypothetical protein
MGVRGKAQQSAGGDVMMAIGAIVLAAIVASDFASKACPANWRG